MSRFLDHASLVWAAGSLGGLVNSLAVWLSVKLGIPLALGVRLAPDFSPNWLYPRLVWGGLWGFLFLLSWPRAPWWVRGLVFSLGPSLAQLLIVFPQKTPYGVLGLGLGALTPLFTLVFNAVWGLAAAALLRITRRA